MDDDAAGLCERLSRSKKTAAEANRAAQAAYRQRQKARNIRCRHVSLSSTRAGQHLPRDNPAATTAAAPCNAARKSSSFSCVQKLGRNSLVQYVSSPANTSERYTCCLSLLAFVSVASVAGCHLCADHGILRVVQACYTCSQAKLVGLEEQVAELSERVHALEIEKARYRAERDALSQRVDTLQSSGIRPSAAEPEVCDA